MTLRLTPVRRALLMAVQRGDVHRYRDGQDYLDGWKRCTAAVELMRSAGWVELGEVGPVKTPWRTTDSAAAVLDRAAEEAVWKELQA